MRRILALLLAAIMTLSLFVVAGATEDTTPPGEVKLLVSGTLDETTMIATYTISMDASGSAGVAALQFCLTPDQNMTQQGDAQLADVSTIFQVQDRGDDPSVKGTFDYTLNNGVGKYLAYGGKVAKTGGHYISGEQDLMTIKYKLTGNSGTLTISDFIACKSGSDKLEERYTCTAPATVTVSTGVTVSGTITSYNAANDATVQLKKNNDVVKSITVSKGAGNFTITDVPAGTYDLVVTKSAHLTYTITGITVGSEDIDLTAKTDKPYQTITLLCGDLNGDGMINPSDINVIYEPANYYKNATDDNRIADLNGDGMINPSDINIIYEAANYYKTTANCTFDF